MGTNCVAVGCALGRPYLGGGCSRGVWLLRIAPISSDRALAELLLSTPLAGRDIHTMAFAEGEVLFGIRFDEDELMACWAAGRALVDRTGRWPVVANHWGTAASIDLRGREPPNGEQGPVHEGEWALADIRAAIAADWKDEEWGSFRYWLEMNLADTKRKYGVAPDEAQVLAALPDDADETALERWLMDWEDENCPPAARPDDGYLEWFSDQEPMLLFPPTAYGPETLAYHGFFAENEIQGATIERLIEILEFWQLRYGAELVANWGTMLGFTVSRPPQTIDDAWTLAVDQDTIAGDTIGRPGVTLRDHARVLVGRNAWFLHCRP